MHGAVRLIHQLIQLVVGQKALFGHPLPEPEQIAHVRADDLSELPGLFMGETVAIHGNGFYLTSAMVKGSLPDFFFLDYWGSLPDTAPRTRRLISLALVLLIAGGAASFIWRGPPIAAELRAMPEVARVEYYGLRFAPLTVVHIRDWHLVPQEFAEVEKLDYAALQNEVEKVQADQLAIVRYLIWQDGIKAIYSEGLSNENGADFGLQVDLVRTSEEFAKKKMFNAEGLDGLRRLSLTIGTAGRLAITKEVQILPLEDERAMQDARPVMNGKLTKNEAKIAARRRAMVSMLPVEGLAVIILGGSHDLGPYLPERTAYVRVTPRSYPQ
jgi:hypothetical protein